MSTIRSTESEPRIVPPLVHGQRLDRATFHERYEAMPPNVRAELVGGVVYMASPLGYQHGRRDLQLAYWLGHYQARVAGVDGAQNATVQFGDFGEPQPDLQLRLDEKFGGQSRIADGYVTGAPELVIEISQTTRKFDLGPKRQDYERAGVREYIVVDLEGREVHWFILRGERFERHVPDEAGTYRSEVFPGLWLDAPAFFASDAERLIATLDRGLATPEHAEFSAKLARLAR